MIGMSKDTTYLVQKDHLRTLLKENFFNSDDLSFVNANPNWALSADTVSKQIFLGYYWGVFIPAWDYQRLMKLGWGIGVFYAELSYTLNLCSEYKISFSLTDAGTPETPYGGECVGKKEIDSSSNKGYGYATTIHITIWERVTKDSIWKLGSIDQATSSLGDEASSKAFPLKNHDKNLIVGTGSSSMEIISYTYRF